MAGRQRLPVQLGGLVGLAERGAGARTRCRRRCRCPARRAPAARSERAGQIEGAAAQEQVRGRAVRRWRPAGMQALQLGLLQPDAVAEHRALAAAARGVRRRRDSPALGEQLLIQATSCRFSAMWVCIRQSGCSRHSAPAAASCSGELVRGEARRDRIEQPTPAVPLARSAPSTRRNPTAPCRAAPPARCGPSAPCRRPAAGRAARPPRTARRPTADGRCSRRSCAGDAVAQDSRRRKTRATSARVFLVGEFELGREGVLVQPVEQLRAVGRDHRRLREVDVAVDEPRGDQRVPAESRISRAGGSSRRTWSAGPNA